MPLKVVPRPGRDNLYIRGTVRGKSVFESTETSDPIKAEEFRAHRETELWQESIYGKKAVVTFAHAAQSYITVKKRSDKTLERVERMLKYFKTTKLNLIGQEQIDKACVALLARGASSEESTKVREIITPVRSILIHAAKRGWCDVPKFDVPEIRKPDTIYLRPDEATRLVNAAADHLKPLIVVLVCTGARMSEALEATWSDVDLFGGRIALRQKQGDIRRAELPPYAIAVLRALPDRSGPVFRAPGRRYRGKTMPPSYHNNGRKGGGQIKRAWATACRRADLPGHWHEWIDKHGRAKREWRPNVTPHDLRHTWATWHYCLHTDLLRLRDDGGWSDLDMVTRYAKLMPKAYGPQIREWWGYAESDGVRNAS